MLKQERGQALILMALAATVIFVAAAIVLDIGLWLSERRGAQTAASEAASAGAQEICRNTGQEVAMAQKWAQMNGYTDGANSTSVEVTYPFSGDDKKIEVVVGRPANLLFTSIFGVPGLNISAGAVAICVPPTPTNTPTRTPTSTFALTPANTLTTPTKTATPAATPPSMGLLVYSDWAKDQLVCQEGPVGRDCVLSASAFFSVDVKATVPPAGGYQGYEVVLQYTSNLTLWDQPGLSENAWPACPDNGFDSSTAATSTQPGRYVLVCKAGPPPRTYKGPLANIHFSCNARGDAQVDLVGGAGAVVSFFERPSIYGNRIWLLSVSKGSQQVADAVHIRCG